MKDQINTIREALELERFACIHESLNVPDHLVSALTALAQLEAMVGKQEPVAWVECDGELVWNNREAAIGRNLYTAAPVAQQPHSTEALRQMLDLANKGDPARWEIGFRNIVAILYGLKHTFEIKDVVERVREIAQQPQAEAVPPSNLIDPGSVVSFAVDRWLAEVSNRPLVNKNRRTLDDTWRQVIRRFGGDPDALLGPSHDELVARAQPQQAEAAVPSSDLSPDEGDPVTLWKEIWRLREAVKGPDGYATWQDAATAERIRRVRAESKQAEEAKAVPTHDDTDLIKQMLEALRSCSGVSHWPALIPTINAARKRLETPQQAEAVPQKPKLIGWRTSDYLMETSDKDKADNWSVHHEMLPIFEGDPYTKLAAAPQQAEASEVFHCKTCGCAMQMPHDDCLACERGETQQAEAVPSESAVVAGARVLNQRSAEACGVNADDQWAIYAEDFKNDVRAVLAAAIAQQKGQS